MRRVRGHEIVIGALVATAIWALIFVLTSDSAAHYEICEITKEGAKQATKDCTSYNIISFLLREIGANLDIVSALITAAATAFIARYTFTLKQSTDRLWKAGDDQYRLAKETADRQAVEIQSQIATARDAARAAQKSADAAVASERARFYAVIDHNFSNCINYAAAIGDVFEREEELLRVEDFPQARISFHNYGKTPGIISDVSTGIVYSEVAPDPVYDVKVINKNIVAGGVDSEVFGTLIEGEPTIGMAHKAGSGKGNLWVFGYVMYEDVFGQPQSHRFLQRYIRLSGSGRAYVLQSYDHKHYNHSS